MIPNIDRVKLECIFGPLLKSLNSEFVTILAEHAETALQARAVSACVCDLSGRPGRSRRSVPYRTVSRPGNETNIFASQGPLHPLQKYNDSQYRELQRSDDY